MGSDQSSQHGHWKGRGKNPKRSQSNDGSRAGDRSAMNSSPRPSICSESDIPYISYTATRPIGEDPADRKVKWNDIKPRARDKHISREKRDSKSKSAGSLVVVRAASEAPNIEKDPLCRRLADIPPFAPIIRGSLKVPWTKDPEISEKIDPNPLIRIGLFYEERLTRHAKSVEREQAALVESITEVEANIRTVMKSYGDRQRKFAKCVERLNRVVDLSHGLTKCHQTLNQALESIEVLNNLLPTEERLEPFVWTTG